MVLAIAFAACSNSETAANTPSTAGAAGNAEANSAGIGARTPNGSTSTPGNQH